MRFKINKPTIIYEDFDGEVVIINLDTGSYYSLERAGAAVWNLLEDTTTEKALVREMMQRYAGNHGEIEMAVGRFLADLRQESLIVSATDKEVENAEVLAENGHRLNMPKLTLDGLIVRKYTDMEELLLLDPIHQVDEMGWPSAKSD